MEVTTSRKVGMAKTRTTIGITRRQVKVIDLETKVRRRTTRTIAIIRVMEATAGSPSNQLTQQIRKTNGTTEATGRFKMKAKKVEAKRASSNKISPRVHRMTIRAKQSQGSNSITSSRHLTIRTITRRMTSNRILTKVQAVVKKDHSN